LLVVADGHIAPSRLARLLIDKGLALHPYTLRRDVAPPAGISYRDALKVLIEDLEVDALFCDFPDDAVAIRDGSAA
jgi:glycerophosphoryl diester phosphodiesterase